MKLLIEVTIIKSSNRRPADHQEFKADILEGTEPFATEEEFQQWFKEEGFELITHGHRLEIQRRMTHS